MAGSEVGGRELCGRDPLLDLLRRFAQWLDRAGYRSYDPYDLWGTAYGRMARRLYYRKHPLGLPLTAPIILLEILCPRGRALFVRKQRFATADAQLALAFMNLHEAGMPEGAWLEKAEALARDLLEQSIPGYRGHCWGYPFDWQSVTGLKRRQTPHITATPYCFDAFLRLHDLTGRQDHLEVAASVARFVAEDLNDTPTGEGAAASSYFPDDHSQVVNASAYRCQVMFEAADRFGVEAYRQKAERNLRFILQSQREDGAWLYAMEDPSQSFIDHFHTCFVLKNLVKINRRRQDPAVRRSIERGYQYYRQALFDPAGMPRPYAVQPRLQIVRLEMYDLAEAIHLGALLRDEIPAAFETARHLARRLAENLQLPDGHFVTRIYRGGIRHTLPFLRWPQAQLFHAASTLWLALGSAGEGGRAEEEPAS